MMDISRQLEELTEELMSVQNKIQTVIRTLQAEQNESSPAEGKKDLTAVEEGQYYDSLQKEGYFVSAIARKVGKSDQFVRDRVALWKSDDMLKEASKERGRRGGIGLAAAIGIARLTKDDHERQRELVKRTQKSPRERRAVLEELNLVFPKKRR